MPNHMYWILNQLYCLSSLGKYVSMYDNVFFILLISEI